MSDKESAIEQIAKDIFISDNSNSQDPEKEWDNALAADRGYARHIARGMHSLGYTNSIVHQCCVDAEASKPRQITTVEELDALGREAVLRDDNGQLFEQNWMLATPDDMWWENLSEYGKKKQLPILPATVLYEPLP